MVKWPRARRAPRVASCLTWGLALRVFLLHVLCQLSGPCVLSRRHSQGFPDEQRASFMSAHLPSFRFVFVVLLNTFPLVESQRHFPCHCLICVICCAFTFRSTVHLESVFVCDCLWEMPGSWPCRSVWCSGREWTEATSELSHVWGSTSSPPPTWPPPGSGDGKWCGAGGKWSLHSGNSGWLAVTTLTDSPP